jgi:DNA adenine methylase
VRAFIDICKPLQSAGEDDEREAGEMAGGRGERGTVGPVLRYPGSKWGLARRIVEMMPECKRYIEPFAGSAAMLLAKPKSDVEIINDLDDELVNLYSVLRDHAKREQLIEDVELTPYAEAEMRAVCSASPAEDAVERARRYLVRSWFDIAGLRPHSAPCFRLPGEKQSNIRPASVWSRLPERIARVGIRLRDVEIRSIDAVRFIAGHNSPGTLVYADPPYVHETRSSKRYYRHEMTDSDHERLLDALLAHSGPVFSPATTPPSTATHWRARAGIATSCRAAPRTCVRALPRKRRSCGATRPPRGTQETRCARCSRTQGRGSRKYAGSYSEKYSDFFLDRFGDRNRPQKRESGPKSRLI